MKLLTILVETSQSTMHVQLNLFIKVTVTERLYYWLLLLDSFDFCAIYFTISGSWPTRVQFLHSWAVTRWLVQKGSWQSSLLDSPWAWEWKNRLAADHKFHYDGRAPSWALHDLGKECCAHWRTICTRTWCLRGPKIYIIYIAKLIHTALHDDDRAFFWKSNLFHFTPFVNFLSYRAPQGHILIWDTIQKFILFLDLQLSLTSFPARPTPTFCPPPG